MAGNGSDEGWDSTIHQMPCTRVCHRYSSSEEWMEFRDLFPRARLLYRGCQTAILKQRYLTLQGNTTSYLVELKHLLFCFRGMLHKCVSQLIFTYVHTSSK